MVTGTVNAALEGTVPFPVQDVQGQWHDVEAVVDSAFTRWLTLPSALIRALELLLVTNIQLALADGSVVAFDVYDAIMIWDGGHRTIEVDASESCPLVGTRMMAGYQLRMDVVVGGRVEIEQLP